MPRVHDMWSHPETQRHAEGHHTASTHMPSWATQTPNCAIKVPQRRVWLTLTQTTSPQLLPQITAVSVGEPARLTAAEHHDDTMPIPCRGTCAQKEEVCFHVHAPKGCAAVEQCERQVDERQGSMNGVSPSVCVHLHDGDKARMRTRDAANNKDLVPVGNVLSDVAHFFMSSAPVSSIPCCGDACDEDTPHYMCDDTQSCFTSVTTSTATTPLLSAESPAALTTLASLLDVSIAVEF